jgi:hypothetical protein
MSGEPVQLTVWVIYDHPADFPGAFVARKWVGDQPTDEMILSDNVARLRVAMQRRYLHCLPRHHSDDPAIVETWL